MLQRIIYPVDQYIDKMNQHFFFSILDCMENPSEETNHHAKTT